LKRSIQESCSSLMVMAPLFFEARSIRGGAPGIRLVRTGMGPVRSRRAAERLRNDPAELLVVAGLCGAVDPSLTVGDVVVASELRRFGAPSYPTESECMCRALEMRGVEVRIGRLLSTDHVVRGSEREALYAEGVTAVDMESAWLAEATTGRPLSVVRVVLDTPAAEIHPLSILQNGWRALASLRRLAPAFEVWASLIGERVGGDPSPRALH
jgi:4-hydroxy-3-methylbut-2-enyl diphosphate reductase